MSRFQNIFIVGLHRGGTSQMFRVFNKVLGYSGVIESHIWPIFRAVVDEVEATVSRVGGNNSASYNSFLIGQWGADRIKDQVFNLINGIYHQRFGPKWVDKTPGFEMIRCVPVLARRFPNAGFIFMKRRPIENIQSRFRRFGQHDFKTACQEWASTMQAWLDVRNTVKERFIEVDQQTMALAPIATATRLSEFLALTKEEASKLSDFIRTSRTEQTQLPCEAPIDLDETNWEEKNKKVLIEICGDLATKFGYSLTGGKFDFDVEPVTIPFNFTADAPGVKMNSVSGKSFFHPLGLRLYSLGDEEYLTAQSIFFNGQNVFVALCESPQSAEQWLRLILSSSNKQKSEYMFSQYEDDLIETTFPPLFGPVSVELRILGGGAGNTRRVELRAPRFEIRSWT